jgi:thioredoxin 1
VYVSVRMADTITESTFQQEVIESEQPVLVDFWAEWCGPCHAVAPILDQIAQERADQLRLVKVNIDEEPELARRFGIMSIPTMILFDGAQPKGMLEKSLGLAES